MNVDERLREAARDAHRASKQLQERRVSKSRVPRPMIAVVAFALVLVVAVPVVILQGGAGAGPSAGTPKDRNVDASEIPREILDYWSKEGNLESIAGEPGWLCPPKPSVGYTAVVDTSGMPADLNYELPGQSPVDTYLRDDGPTCNQPPALVMLAFTDQSQATATAGMTVWPSTTRFEDTCPPGSCSVGDDEGTSLENLTINDEPAKLKTHNETFQLWWVDKGGVPLYSEASGISRTELLDAAESINADPASHTVDVTGEISGDMQIVEQQVSLGVWEPGYWRMDVYDIDGTSVAVEAKYDSGQTPYSRYASAVSFLDIVEVDGSPAVWIPEGGNLLIFEGPNGVLIHVEGAPTAEQAVEIAKALN
jgi:hypothetical protein